VRAVNLIPAEERRARPAARAGALSYLVVGVLIAALAGVTSLVLTNQQVSDREAEVAQLEQRRTAAQARADSLRAFAEFRSMQEARTATVTSLAQSRFDWERVLRELSLVLPADVWLVELTGTVSPSVQLDGGADISSRDSVQAPALEMVGCTVSQDAVGRLVAALRDIDGVTRVSVFKSERPELEQSDASTGAAGGQGAESGDDCRTKDFITRFEIVIAFDAVPAPEAASALPPEPGAPAAAEGAETSPESQASEGALQEGVDEGQEAANLVPGA
jgi:Tfp pilus assembly protein PilN